MTKDECVTHGGHCWVDAPYSLGNGWQTETEQSCKHCPARRMKVSREPYEYRDLRDRPESS